MRVGENTDSSNGSSAGDRRVWGPGRHRLSFGEQGPTHRQAIRRRVFAQLAPQEAGEQLEAAHGRDNSSDTDSGGEPSFIVEIRQVALPPTPPRRRSGSSNWRAVESSDEDDEIHHTALVLGGGQQSAPQPTTLPLDGGEGAARLALEQFRQLRRQRFMSDQHARYLDTAALANLSIGGQESPTRQHFPSNDVDSYWYNQPSPTSEVSPVSVSVPVPVPVPLHRVSRLQMQQYLPPPPPPPVSRSLLSDESRRAMLEVLRANNSSAARAAALET
ncbi:hypothetical protein IWW38_003970, partial [Coemansia aciculifera]